MPSCQGDGGKCRGGEGGREGGREGGADAAPAECEIRIEAKTAVGSARGADSEKSSDALRAPLLRASDGI